jgi:uncharacterized membrane protein YkvA (DUF1232 family)
MADLFSLLRFMCIGIFLLAALALVLMHLPNSPLKTLAQRALAGVFAMLMPLYVVSPVDVVPEAVLGPVGIVDDLVVIVLGVAAGKYAIKGPKHGSDAVAKY